jgi:hypothetical protein
MSSAIRQHAMALFLSITFSPVRHMTRSADAETKYPESDHPIRIEGLECNERCISA